MPDLITKPTHSPIPSLGTDTLPCVRNAQWYAAYTLPRHEKHAARQLDVRVIEHFLPLYHVTRKWQHRHAEFELPLFPGYLFVHIAPYDRIRVLTAPGILEIVGIRGRPTPLQDQEIETLRTLVSSRNVSPTPYLQRGSRVRFTTGALAGLQGTVVRIKGSLRVIISIEAIKRSISVEIDRSELELIN